MGSQIGDDRVPILKISMGSVSGTLWGWFWSGFGVVLGGFWDGFGRVWGGFWERFCSGCSVALPCPAVLHCAPVSLPPSTLYGFGFPYFSRFSLLSLASLLWVFSGTMLCLVLVRYAALCCAVRPRGRAKRAIVSVPSLTSCGFPLFSLGFPGFSCCPFLAVAALLCVFSGTLFCAGRVCSAVLCCACAVRPRGRAKRAIVSVPSFTFYVLTLVSLAFPWLPRCPFLPLASRLGVISGILFSAVPC